MASLDEESKEHAPTSWDLSRFAPSVGFDGQSFARGWDDVVEKTRAKMEEARIKSLELTEEARSRTSELVGEASKLGDTIKARINDAVAVPEDMEAPPPPPPETPVDEEAPPGEDQDSWWPSSLEDEGLLSKFGENASSLTRSIADGSAGFMGGVTAKIGEGSRDLGQGIAGIGQRLGDGSKELANKFSSTVTDTRECGLSRAQRFRWYVILLGVSTVFFGLAFQLLALPSKFAVAFAIGTLSSLAAKAMLNGPYTQIKLMFNLPKLPYTLALLAATGLTLYLCFTHANLIFILVASISQVAALLYYLFADTPGGKAGIRLLFKAVLTTARLIARPFLMAFE